MVGKSAIIRPIIFTQGRDASAMTAILKTQKAGTCQKSLTDCRVRPDGTLRPIVSFYPSVGRGGIEHEFISSKDAERGIDRCGRRNVWETVSDWIAI